MKELSLNILDITENSVKAKATRIVISIAESDKELSITVTDNGVGMTEKILESVSNPFCTTRTTRKVGMGVPLFRFAAEQTGGSFAITSKHIDAYPEEHGTSVSATFNKEHLDFTPLGDVISTVTTLIQGHPDVDFLFEHKYGDKAVLLDTAELRAVLEDVPLNSYEVIVWIKDNLTEQYDSFWQK